MSFKFLKGVFFKELELVEFKPTETFKSLV